MRPIRTLLVDDSRTFLAVAAAHLSKYSRIELLGQANSGMPLVIGLFDRNCATESSRPGSRAYRTNAIRQHPAQAGGTLPG